MSIQPTEDDVAAALVAISCYLAEEDQLIEQESAEWRWRASGILSVQRMCFVRSPQHPTWGTIERIRRAGRGGTGILGL